MKGYRVLEAAKGERAMLISTEHQGPIHLLLSDVVMPEMSGPELATRLVSKRPATKVLYIGVHGRCSRQGRCPGPWPGIHSETLYPGGSGTKGA